MKRHFLIILILTFLMACSTNYSTVRHVTSKNRNRYYHVKTDKGKKRVKYVNKKIVNQRNVVRKGPKNKPEKEKIPSQEEAIPNESDTTGFL